jgi:hypothetical protein
MSSRRGKTMQRVHEVHELYPQPSADAPPDAPHTPTPDAPHTPLRRGKHMQRVREVHELRTPTAKEQADRARRARSEARAHEREEEWARRTEAAEARVAHMEALLQDEPVPHPGRGYDADLEAQRSEAWLALLQKEWEALEQRNGAEARRWGDMRARREAKLRRYKAKVEAWRAAHPNAEWRSAKAYVHQQYRWAKAMDARPPWNWLSSAPRHTGSNRGSRRCIQLGASDR